MKESTTITVKGQVTIPKQIREQLGLKPGDRVFFEKEDDRVVIKSAKTVLDFRGYVKAERLISMEQARKIVKDKKRRKIKEGTKK